MTTQNISEIDSEHAPDLQIESQSATPAPKAPYETPRLVTYGRLTHLTLQNISGGGDSGST